MSTALHTCEKRDLSVLKEVADTFITTLVSHSLYVIKTVTVQPKRAGPGHGSGH